MPAFCDCCGLVADLQAGEDCPRCQYPVDPAKEAHFLAAAIRDLQRVADHGGANISVFNLIHRYQWRLNSLRQLSLTAARRSSVPAAASFPPAQADLPVASGAPAPTVSPALPPVPVPIPASLTAGANPVSAPAAWAPVPTSPARQPVKALPSRPATPRRVFSFRSFFADQAINIVASLGAFLILTGALSFVTTNPNLWLSFLMVFCVHALFGITGFATARLPTFRIVAVIYTIIFALLVPLVGFSAYRLVSGNAIPLPPAVLLALASAYASVVYIVLARFQRFTPFAYLGIMALLVADLAVARALGLDFWWWPDMAMLLAFASLVSVQRPTDSTWPFSGAWLILRQPVRLLMHTIALVAAIAVVLIAFYSFVLDGLGTPLGEVRFSLVSLTLLLLAWCCLALWVRKQTAGAREIAYLFLVSVLALCYSLDFSQTGYTLVLTGVALLYHLLNRFAGRLLTPLSRFSPDLDTLALALVVLVAFLCAPLLPVQLFASVYGTPPPLAADGQTVAHLLALVTGLSLTVIITLRRAAGGLHAPAHPAWCWLLLLSGFLLTWGTALGSLALHAVPLWSFLVLALVLVALTVVLRQRYSSAWANPLDILALWAIVLTVALSGKLDRGTISILFLFFAALTYAVLLFQRRWAWLFLSLAFAVPGQLLLVDRPAPLALLSVLLPLAAVAICRLAFHRANASASGPQQPGGWEWPLLAAGLLAGVMFAIHEALAPQSVLAARLHLAVPASLELALPALTWYASAALARRKWWLAPTLVFAPGALLLPGNAFWVLAALTPVLVLLGIGIRRVADSGWALPLHLVALCAAVLTAYSGLTQGHLTATVWVLLGFAVLAYLLGALDDLPLALWIAPCFATAALVISAGPLGNLYAPPIMAVTCAALGVSLHFLHLLPPSLINLARKSRVPSPTVHEPLFFILPFYATALVAALLTGGYGMRFGINVPFPGAVPDTLLVYALVAFVVLLVERQPRWLALVAGLAIWGLVLATQLTASYLVGVGLALGLGGLAAGQLIPSTSQVPASQRPFYTFTWGWPWYAAALAAAGLSSLWPLLPGPQPPTGFLAASALGFALLAYLVGWIEETPAWLWFGPVFATVSLLYTPGEFWRLVAMTLVCSAAGVSLHLSDRLACWPRLLADRRGQMGHYALPWYITAGMAALLTGVSGIRSGINTPFSSAVPDSLLVYALVAFVILLVERQPRWLGLVAGFAIWGLILATQLTAAFVTLAGIGAGVIGLGAGRLCARAVQTGEQPPFVQALLKLTWSWPWYVAALCAAGVTGAWMAFSSQSPGPALLGFCLLAFTALALLVMLVERMPELLVFPAGLAAWAIWQWQTLWAPAPLMGGYIVLCVLIFVLQFTWRIVPPATHWIAETLLHTVLGVGGQSLVVLAIIAQDGLLADSGWLAQTGVGALLVLAELLGASGRLYLNAVARQGAAESDEVRHQARIQRARRLQQWCIIGAGLLLSLAVSWELAAVRLTRFELLTLAPASYLIVIAPFVMHNRAFAGYQSVGQISAILGAALLLLPTLWLSFSDAEQLYTLILLGETLALLLLGIITRIRTFVLSGAGLIIIGGLHMLFLSLFGISPSLVLALLGLILLALATGLALARRRLQSAWTQWE